MLLESFRELLAKKAEDPSLINIIRFVKDDILADIVVDSLEKMARSSHKGDSANLAIRDFGTEMDPEHEPNMLHDALSHHVSHYKSALNSGKPEVANQHAKQVFRLMDMADQAQKHSHGKLNVQAVSPHAWERNGKTKQFTEADGPVQAGRKKPGQFVTDTKGWRFRGNDYGFLQQAPHSSYAGEVRKHGHNQAYPFEQIKVNGKFVDVEDVPESAGYKEHPFDKHPIMNHFEDPAGKRTPEKDKQYLEHRDAYANSPHMDQYFSNQEAREAANPEKHKARGSQAADPVHKETAPLDISKLVPDQAPAAPKKAAAAKKEKAPLSDDEREHLLSLLSPEVKAKYLAQKKEEGGNE